MVSITNAIVLVMVVVGVGLFTASITGFGKQNQISNYQGQTIQNNSANFQKFAEAELPDKCKTPPGYTDADWKEHLGHHPDRYAECLA